MRLCGSGYSRKWHPYEQLGYWIVEALVDRQTEYYPRGGIKFLVGTVLRTDLLTVALY